MERKDFFRTLGLAGLAFAGMRLVNACSPDDSTVTAGDATGTDTTGGDITGGDTSGTAGDCSVAPTETEGPFPTHTPSSLATNNITSDRTGIPLEINIAVTDKSNNCNALEGAIVDIWHCDKDGNYSEYGGSGMQQANYTTVHFLRGRQVTDADGKVSFTSIFPGWYTGRATHIHVHIYNASGTSLLVTQIAFPEGSNSAVVQVNAASDYGYTKGMNGYTYNANDNVFSDDTNGAEIAAISGSVAEGYVLEHTITVQS